jgi:NAD(P)-dependent dehydrogenase (short-subunit alcohol dehydrogenase family)
MIAIVGMRAAYSIDYAEAAMVAIVTGGSKGIGLAIARAFRERGMQVAISSRHDKDLRRAVEQLGSAADVHAVVADVRNADDAQRLIDETVARFGGLDVLVNNAGVGRFANVADMSLDDWRQVVDTNLSGVFYCTRAALPELRKRGAGYIVNISSLAGKNAFTGGAAYCASKAGLNAFSEALMQEVRYDNIRVSYVMPGSVATAFGDRGSDRDTAAAPAGADWKLTSEDVARVVVDLISHEARSLASRVELRPSRPRKG